MTLGVSKMFEPFSYSLLSSRLWSCYKETKGAVGGRVGGAVFSSWTILLSTSAKNQVLVRISQFAQVVTDQLSE